VYQSITSRIVPVPLWLVGCGHQLDQRRDLSGPSRGSVGGRVGEAGARNKVEGGEWHNDH
jgi:hypothetical protein